MTRLHRSLIMIIVGLTLFFNIERLDFGNENTINIATFVYILGTCFVLLVTITPFSWWSLKMNIGLMLLVYLLCKLLLADPATLFGGFYTYLTITEVAMLVGLMILANNLSRHLEDFQKVIEYVTFPDTHTRVQELTQATETIDTELFRSRRYQRPLSVIIIEPDVQAMQHQLHPMVEEVQQAMMKRFMMSSIGRRFSQKLRRTDLILESPNLSRFVLLCPETDAESSLAVIKRVAEAAEELEIPFSCGTSSFPHEALTFEELVNKAEENLKCKNKCVGLTPNPQKLQEMGAFSE